MAKAAGSNDGLFFLYDTASKRQFLVDTGAEVSVLPATGLDTHVQKLADTDAQCLYISVYLYGCFVWSCNGAIELTAVSLF